MLTPSHKNDIEVKCGNIGTLLPGMVVFQGMSLVVGLDSACDLVSTVDLTLSVYFMHRGSKKNSKSVPQNLQRLAPEQGLAAVDAVTVVPNLNTSDVQQEGHHSIDAEQSRAHVYFKDLKLLADDEESEDDFGYSDSDLGSCISSPSESNKNVRNFMADFMLKCNSMTIYYVCSKQYRGIKLK